MPHQNERVELAMQILECRRQLRLMAWDDAACAKIRTDIERLEQSSARSTSKAASLVGQGRRHRFADALVAGTRAHRRASVARKQCPRRASVPRLDTGLFPASVA
jgi:hypothetical protein